MDSRRTVCPKCPSGHAGYSGKMGTAESPACWVLGHSAWGQRLPSAGSVPQWAPRAAADWPRTGQPADGGRTRRGGGARQPCPRPIASQGPSLTVLADSRGPLPSSTRVPQSLSRGPVSLPETASTPLSVTSRCPIRRRAHSPPPAGLGSRGPRRARTCLDLAWAAVGPFLRSTVTVSQSLSAMAGRAGKAVRPAAPQQLLETRRRDVPSSLGRFRRPLRARPCSHWPATRGAGTSLGSEPIRARLL